MARLALIHGSQRLLPGRTFLQLSPSGGQCGSIRVYKFEAVHQIEMRAAYRSFLRPPVLIALSSDLILDRSACRSKGGS